MADNSQICRCVKNFVCSKCKEEMYGGTSYPHAPETYSSIANTKIGTQLHRYAVIHNTANVLRQQPAFHQALQNQPPLQALQNQPLLQALQNQPPPHQALQNQPPLLQALAADQLHNLQEFNKNIGTTHQKFDDEFKKMIQDFQFLLLNHGTLTDGEVAYLAGINNQRFLTADTFNEKQLQLLEELYAHNPKLHRTLGGDRGLHLQLFYCYASKQLKKVTNEMSTAFESLNVFNKE